MANEDRIFVKNGRKHYRPRYSITEVKLGGAVLLGLCVVSAWIVWKGRPPDPTLTAAPPALNRRATDDVDRGPLPKDLAPPGWQEGGVAVFDPSNLYEKIDGREGYYKSFGFQKMWFLALTQGADRSLDLELYDLGSAANALGACAGELPEKAQPQAKDGGLFLQDRNALYLTRGKLYLRAIGSDESPEVQAALQAVATGFATVPGEALPWSYGLFLGLGIGPGQVSYQPQDAFSFGFAKDVHVGLASDGETELFVSPQADENTAKALVDSYLAGFVQYGEKVPGTGGGSWIQDRYLAKVSTATVRGRFVVGVKGAADVPAGQKWLEQLMKAVDGLPKDLPSAAAAPEASDKRPEASYE